MRDFRCRRQLDELSESDIECILESLAENKGLDFDNLKAKAHDVAYNKAESEARSFVPLEYIIEQEQLPQEQVLYIKENYEFST